MFFTIYKITNKINGKYYIGKHQTENVNDNYMGSGKLIIRAIQKYGIDNFEKEILYVFDNENDMNLKEAELVVISKDSYNLCNGGQGGFSYINRTGKNGSLKGVQKREEVRQDWEPKRLENYFKWRNSSHSKISDEKRVRTILERYGKSGFQSFLGRLHSEETKNKMSTTKKGKNIGENNSQYGTIWITNGSINKKIKKTEDIPDNWYKGRI